jgi:hypothetical protein
MNKNPLFRVLQQLKNHYRDEKNKKLVDMISLSLASSFSMQFSFALKGEPQIFDDFMATAHLASKSRF